jgi:AmiR/NasT family two-component response regulator
VYVLVEVNRPGIREEGEVHQRMTAHGLRRKRIYKASSGKPRTNVPTTVKIKIKIPAKRPVMYDREGVKDPHDLRTHSPRSRLAVLPAPLCWAIGHEGGAQVSYRETEHLRVLIANERKDRLALVAPIVAALGHEVIAREIEVEDVGAVTARERPDVALVGLGESSEHALHLVEKIVHESACPVIALIHAPDPDFVKEASKRGVFAYITDADAKDWQSSIDIVLRRFAEYHDLEGAFGRRAVTERAKGILMERHSIDETTAFDMLRDHARTANRKLVDVASAVVDGHRLLPKQPQVSAARRA